MHPRPPRTLPALPRTPRRAKPTIPHAATPAPPPASSATNSALNTAHHPRAMPLQQPTAGARLARAPRTYKTPRHSPHACYLNAQSVAASLSPSLLSLSPFRQQSSVMSHSYDHLVLDPAVLGGGGSSWADPGAVEIPPQLLAALGEYLSAGRGGEDDTAEAEADDEFMMYEFKVRRCARARSHDWTACPYAHPGEAARRRDPRRVAYTGEPCPDFRRRPGAACPRGNACPFAHGTFELWLHPSRYRTRPCRAGAACRRRVCFFAHTAAELRAFAASGKDDGCSPLSLSPKSTLASLWESPPVSPVVEGRVRWLDAIDDASEADAEVEELMLAMRELSFRKAAAASAATVAPPVLPPVTEEDGPDLGWVSELVM